MAQQRLQSFAEQLRGYRRDKGLTQEQLGEIAGLSARGIRALEQGERSSPHRDTVRLLVEALQLSGSQATGFEESVQREESASSPKPGHPIAGFLGARPERPLVAREREIEVLISTIDSMSSGYGRFVMLAGESGIGKTRLAQEAALMLGARGFLVAAGRCYEPERALPYYPFLEVLDTLYSAAPMSLRSDVPRRWDLVRRLLPGIEVETPAIELGSQDVQARLFWAVTSFIQALARYTPLALLFDDLHWADESSVRLLHHVARQARSDRVLLIGTYRETDVKRRDPLERMLRDTQREGLLEEIALRRLGPSDTAALTSELLGRPNVPVEFARLVYRYTDGNPFFTQEVLRALVERGDILRSDGTWDEQRADLIEVPRSVRAAIGERLSRLSEGSQEILRAASVLGQTFSFDGLKEIAGCEEEEIEGGLEQALTADLLRESGKDEYAFNHALIVQTLYEEIPSRRRRKLHLAVGEWMERLLEPVRRKRASELAWHFLRGDDTERALRYSMLAGDGAAAVFAHSEAEQHYLTALDLAREHTDTGAEAEALEKLGVVLRYTGRYPEALGMLESAADLYRSQGNLRGEVRATQQGVFVHYMAGSPVEAISGVHIAVERLERLSESERPPGALADLYSSEAISLWPSARYQDVLTAGNKSVQLARSDGDDRTLAGGLWAQGWVQTMVGKLPDARRALEEAEALFKATGETWWRAQCHGNIGRTYLHEGDTDMARQLLQRSLSAFESSHDAAETAWALCYMGDVQLVRGEWDQAQHTFERAADLVALRGGPPRYWTHVRLHLLELLLLRGGDAQGIQDLADAAESSGEVAALRKANRLLAECDVHDGHPEEAVRRLVPLLDGLRNELPHAFPPPVLALAWHGVGDSEKAEELTHRRVQQFRDQNRRRSLVQWLPVKVVLHADRGDGKAAEDALMEALPIAHSMPYPHAEGRILQAGGLAQMQRGEVEAARESLGKALDVFQRLGARPDVERTERIMHARLP